MKRLSIFLATVIFATTLSADSTTDACQMAINALQKYNGAELCALLEEPYALLSDISNNSRPNELNSELDILLMILAELSNEQAYNKTEEKLYLTLERAKELAIIEAKTCITMLQFVQNVSQETLNSIIEIYLEKLTFVKDHLTFVHNNRGTSAYKNVAYTYARILDANGAVVFLNSFFTENPYLPYGLPTNALAIYGEEYKSVYTEFESLYQKLKLEDKYDIDFVRFLPKPCDDYEPADLKYMDWFTD